WCRDSCVSDSEESRTGCTPWHVRRRRDDARHLLLLIGRAGAGEVAAVDGRWLPTLDARDAGVDPCRERVLVDGGDGSAAGCRATTPGLGDQCPVEATAGEVSGE